MLEVEELAAVRNQQLLFKKISLQLDTGQLLHVIGANGAGKSTLLQILSGIRKPSYGQVRWQQQDIHQQHGLEFSLYLGHRLAVKSCLTVLEHLKMYASMTNAPLNTNWRAILERFMLLPLAGRLAGSLSAGQRQRLALTRLAILQAPLWLLDEPFTAVDGRGREMIEHLISQHLITGGIVVMTSHQSIHLPEVPIKQLELGLC